MCHRRGVRSPTPAAARIVVEFQQLPDSLRPGEIDHLFEEVGDLRAGTFGRVEGVALGVFEGSMDDGQLKVEVCTAVGVSICWTPIWYGISHLPFLSRNVRSWLAPLPFGSPPPTTSLPLISAL